MMKRQGFSLVELIVVTAVLLVIGSMLAPTLNRVFYNAQNTECKVHLKSLHQAISMYVDDNDNFLPGPCEGNARPYYYDEIRYNKKGELFRRNQRLASFLRGYMETMDIDGTYRYNPALICPSSADIVELGEDARYRPHYNVVNPAGVVKPFGIWKRFNKEGTLLPMEASKSIDVIENPSDTEALKDALDKNKTMDSLSDLPVHPEFLENYLFYDGRIESIQNLTF
jgi:prepilin-type N-terminal cleavage/methylation domain-containing protein